LETAKSFPGQDGVGDGEWLSPITDIIAKADDVPCYDTKIISISKERLIWAKCPGYTKYAYFPARLCDVDEILMYETVDVVPENEVVVEYINIPKQSAKTRIVMVKAKDTRPYYHKYKQPMHVQYLLKEAKGGNADEAASESEDENVEKDEPDDAVLPDYNQWDPATMEQLHLVSLTEC
jgi:hypothetical protein